jgi:tetratricopeptide (TPR) repeat protein
MSPEEYLTRKQILLDKLRPDALVGNDSKYADLLLDDGVHFIKIKDYSNALDRLYEAERYDPEDKRIKNYISRALRESRGDSLKIVQANLKAEGLRLLDELGDYRSAFTIFQSAVNQFPEDLDFRLYLMETSMILARYDEAFEQSKRLALLEYPDRIKSLRIAIHCSLAAERFKDAESYCLSYLEQKPQDEFIQSVHQRLQNKQNVEELIFLFQNR